MARRRGRRRQRAKGGLLASFGLPFFGEPAEKRLKRKRKRITSRQKLRAFEEEQRRERREIVRGNLRDVRRSAEAFGFGDRSIFRESRRKKIKKKVKSFFRPELFPEIE